MAFTTLTLDETATSMPMTQALWRKVKYNFDALYGELGTLDRVYVTNGSFEVDSDEDGIPDTWTQGLYPGGAAALYSVNPGHGAKAYSFTHPGGASNGGGYLDSGYFEVSEEIDYFVNFLVWNTAIGIHNKVQVRYFDQVLNYISLDTVYDSILTPLTYVYYTAFFRPPATARYAKIRIVGGFNDVDQAGTVYFDGVSVGILLGAPQGATTDVTETVTELTVTPVKIRESVARASGDYTYSIDVTEFIGIANFEFYINGTTTGIVREITGTPCTFSGGLPGIEIGDNIQLYAYSTISTPTLTTGNYVLTLLPTGTWGPVTLLP